MANVSVQEVNVWADHVKLNVDRLDSDLEESVSQQVISQISTAYNVTSWITETSTPQLVRKIIAMWYVGWFFQRTYSEDDGINTYGVMLLAQAQKLIDGIVAGTIVLPDVDVDSDLKLSQPLFYPTDASSIPRPDDGWVGEGLNFGNYDRSVGREKFSMGQVF